VPAAPEPGISATLKVRVHNIGTEDARQVTVWAEETPTGRIIGERTMARLPRPRNMLPSHATVSMPWIVGANTTGVRVVVDAANVIEEIYEGNNAAEIFVDTNFDRRTYYQFAFTTAEIKTEGQYYNFTIYNEPWECRVYKGPDFWSAEAAIPYTSLHAAARPGRTWGINVYRNTQTFRMPESQEQRRKGWKRSERNALSATFGSHHEPHRFAEVTFGPRSDR